MNRKLFVNLAAADLGRSVEFFTKLGFEFDPRFTDETATCMLVGEDAYFMLLRHDKFADFARKPYADPAAQTQALYAITAESRAAVDDRATPLGIGGSAVDEPHDLGFMYYRAFADPGGHHWEVLWMDTKAAEEGPPAAAEASAA